jgi:hypothetical protein
MMYGRELDFRKHWIILGLVRLRSENKRNVQCPKIIFSKDLFSGEIMGIFWIN